MTLKRLDANPILTPGDLKPTRDGLEVFCTLNPGAIRFGDEVLLLVRVGQRPVPEEGYVSYLYYDVEAGERKIGRIPRTDPDLSIRDARKFFYRGRMLLSSMSHIHVARSSDGRRFAFDPAPAIQADTAYEAYGCEDARITPLEGRYYITYTAVSDRGVTVAMASTDDFERYEKHGLIFPPYQKDVAIFPEKIGGLYVCRHRPYKSEFNPASIWTAWSPDLLSWGRHEMTLAPAPGTWEGERVGCGAPPVRTGHGWLEIYHAADANGRYCLGVMLSDPANPQRILTRSSKPVFEPRADYELDGVYADCVFSNGLIAGPGGTLTVYYGAGDRVCAAAATTVDEMISAANE